MPDLHGWITQQIDEVEQGEPPHARTCDSLPSTASCCGATECDCAQYDPTGPCDCGWPAQVLRRCAADRKILAEHKPCGGKWEPYACEGCGMDGSYMPARIVEHVNDCPTLLALAEGYGLTEEQRAGLDRPEKERPEPTGPSLLPDGLADAMYGQLWAHVIGTRPVEPRPEVKAMKILAPELKKIPGYIPTTDPEA